VLTKALDVLERKVARQAAEERLLLSDYSGQDTPLKEHNTKEKGKKMKKKAGVQVNQAFVTTIYLFTSSRIINHGNHANANLFMFLE
jgi:hypothetical protein